jgi:hypothetical protein
MPVQSFESPSGDSSGNSQDGVFSAATGQMGAMDVVK